MSNTTIRGYLYLFPHLLIESPWRNLLNFRKKEKPVHLSLFSENIDISPFEDLLLSRPLPNKSYVVAGTKENPMGWFVPVPAGINDIHFSFIWDVFLSKIGVESTITHHFNLSLEEGSLAELSGVKIWSMDVLPWNHMDEYDRGEPPVNTLPGSHFWTNTIHPARFVEKESEVLFCHHGITLGRSCYREKMRIPAISLTEFSERCLANGICDPASSLAKFLAT